VNSQTITPLHGCLRSNRFEVLKKRGTPERNIYGKNWKEADRKGLPRQPERQTPPNPKRPGHAAKASEKARNSTNLKVKRNRAAEQMKRFRPSIDAPGNLLAQILLDSPNAGWFHGMRGGFSQSRRQRTALLKVVHGKPCSHVSVRWEQGLLPAQFVHLLMRLLDI